MSNTPQLEVATDDLRTFLATIPCPDQIRQRIAHNARETTVLKRLLKLAEDAELARGATHPSVEGAKNGK